MSLFLLTKSFPGHPCDEHGNDLLPNTPPPPRHTESDTEDWTPYRNRTEFETAQFVFCQAKMSTRNIDTLLDLWASTLLKHDDTPPFANHTDLFNTIDSTPLGDVPWQSFSLNYNGEVPQADAPSWMTSAYDVWFRDPRLVVRNMIDNPDYANQFDSAPTRSFDSEGNRQYQDFMTGDWAWEEAVCFKYVVHFLSYNSYLGSDCKGP
jgi:hypothetical protein